MAAVGLGVLIFVVGRVAFWLAIEPSTGDGIDSLPGDPERV